MDDREFEGVVARALRHDYSAGAEAFRDALLARCLDELDADVCADDDSAGYDDDLDDAEIELLAAAGDVEILNGRRVIGG